MPAQWTGQIVGQMHIHGITARDLASQLDYHPKYVSAVLNGKREPKGAEETFQQALDVLISKQGSQEDQASA